MKLDPGMHIGMHSVFFGKAGVTTNYLEATMQIGDTNENQLSPTNKPFYFLPTTL
jgi:hypothetical protein